MPEIVEPTQPAVVTVPAPADTSVPHIVAHGVGSDLEALAAVAALAAPAPSTPTPEPTPAPVLAAPEMVAPTPAPALAAPEMVAPTTPTLRPDGVMEITLADAGAGGDQLLAPDIAEAANKLMEMTGELPTVEVDTSFLTTPTVSRCQQSLDNVRSFFFVICLHFSFVVFFSVPHHKRLQG